MTLSLRPSVLAGSWYPADSAELSEDIQAYLRFAQREMLKQGFPENKSRIVIAPHAGYCYSAQTAAYSYVSLQQEGVERVLILSPSHRVFLKSVAASSANHFETPLGAQALDISFIESLKKRGALEINDNAHHLEHAIEIQLPFVKTCFPDALIVPLVVGQLPDEKRTSFAEILSEIIDEKTVIVISSDFTHYGESFRYTPFKDHIRENLKELDGGAIACIVNGDADAFQRYVRSTGATICGQLPIELILRTEQAKARKGSLLHYTTSAEKTGDYEQSVSYAALAFY